MCGRFTQFYTWAEVHKAMRLLPHAPNLRPRYNIAPTTTIDVVVAGMNHNFWACLRGAALEELEER